MQLPVAAAPGVLLIVRKKCNLLPGNVKTYSFTSVLITGEFVVILLLFYALAIELHLLQLSVFVFDDMYIMLLVLQAIAVHQKLVPSLYVMYIATP